MSQPRPLRSAPFAVLGASNSDVVRRLFDEVINQGRLEVAEDICAADAWLHAPLPNLERGPAGLRRLAADLHAGFADLEVAIDELIVSDDTVVVRWRTVRQTHTGAYRGVPPTGRSLHLTAIQIFRLQDARITEAWLELDALGGAQQMGVVPPEGRSAGRRALFVLGSLVRFAALEARWAIKSRGR